ncbi:MAG: desaturase [Alteromonadaceae bacterium]|nr:MAG: desaturase [Alteromonadaceae bacterium]
MSELAPFIVILSAVMLYLGERYWPAHDRQKPTRVGWYLRSLSITALNFVLFLVVDSLIHRYATDLAMFDFGNTLSPIAGASLGYFIFTFVVYWWHRARHRFAFLWKWFHQLHHSPTRIETLTAYYIHPFDLMANLIISHSIVFILLGLNLEGAGWYTVFTGIAGFLIHANIRLPRWVGFVFQTPEMHRLHHKSDHHAHNYSDIVIWDVLFGTYQNPKQDIKQCGFKHQTETHWLRMLVGKIYE